MSESVVPYNRFEYDTSFMDQVDTLNPKTGPNFYLCFLRLTEGDYKFFKPRKSVIQAFANKDDLKYSTDEHNITINGKKIFYFLTLLNFNIYFTNTSRKPDDGDSAQSKYGQIYDAILKYLLLNESKNKCYIIYATDIKSAENLFIQAVKKGTVTLDDIKIVDTAEDIEQKYRRNIDKNIKAKKKEEAKIAAEENIEKGKERSTLIINAIASIPPTVDLRWQVFRLHDIGDTIVSENKVLPKFSIPVSECNPNNPTINTSDSSKVIHSNDTVDIPQDFSWVKKVNESNSIHVISVKRYHPNTIDEYDKYTILKNSERYQVTIKKLELNGPPHSDDDELEFKKRMILPFIDESNYVDKYFVLNAEDETGVLCYFLRKYGICDVESPDENKYTFTFMTTPTILSFDINSLFDAIPFVLHCLKNDKLLMKQIDNGPSTLTPEVLVLSQLTKEQINGATSVYFVVEKETKHREKNAPGIGFVWDYFGDIDGFTEPVVMHKKKWSLGCVQSILDEPDCTNYNELKLLTTGETPRDSYNIDKYKQYLLTGKFPDTFGIKPEMFSLVTRGSDDYCRLVAIEPYGNVFYKRDPIMSTPGVGLENKQHPVFYIFNAANKASAVNAFNAKLSEELNNVISVENGEKVVNTANLESNPFLKTFKSVQLADRTRRITKVCIEPFVDSIIKGTPDIKLLIPENIELVESNENGGGGGQGFAWENRSDIPSSSPSSSQQVQRAQNPTVYRQGVAKPAFSDSFGIGAFRNGRGGKSNKKRTKKSRRNKVRSNKRNARSNKRATRSNKRKYNNTRKK